MWFNKCFCNSLSDTNIKRFVIEAEQWGMSQKLRARNSLLRPKKLRLSGCHENSDSKHSDPLVVSNTKTQKIVQFRVCCGLLQDVLFTVITIERIKTACRVTWQNRIFAYIILFCSVSYSGMHLEC